MLYHEALWRALPAGRQGTARLPIRSRAEAGLGVGSTLAACSADPKSYTIEGLLA